MPYQKTKGSRSLPLEQIYRKLDHMTNRYLNMASLMTRGVTLAFVSMNLTITINNMTMNGVGSYTYYYYRDKKYLHGHDCGHGVDHNSDYDE